MSKKQEEFNELLREFNSFLNRIDTFERIIRTKTEELSNTDNDKDILEIEELNHKLVEEKMELHRVIFEMSKNKINHSLSKLSNSMRLRIRKNDKIDECIKELSNLIQQNIEFKDDSYYY